MKTGRQKKKRTKKYIPKVIKKNKTVFSFDEDSIKISDDLIPVFNFFKNIEGEVDVVVNVNLHMIEIYERYQEIVGFAKYLTKQLPKGMKFEEPFQMKKDHINFNLKLEYPVISQMIILFSFLEAIFTIYLSYSYEKSNKEDLRKLSMNDTRKELKNFVDNYIFNKNNTFFRKNEEKLKRITIGGFLELRNSLAHMFTVGNGKLVVYSDDRLSKDINEIKEKVGQLSFISPTDLLELIKGAQEIFLKEMSEDFKTKNKDFNRKIFFVKDAIKQHGFIKANIENNIKEKL